ncbi:MAG: SAM-dependent methyltransferase, partial [Burkholderiales bacterium]
LELKPSPYKELSQTLRVLGTRVVAERSNALGLLTVVESPQVPFRHAPGLSLNATQEPPAQLGIFTDGEGLSALTHMEGGSEALGYLGYLTSAAPYYLLPAPRVLVLGAGAGSDVLQALHHRAASIDAVELNPALVRLVREEFARFSGDPYGMDGVKLHVAEARGFAASTEQRFDVIQLALLDAFGASSAGLYALAETYLYTAEAFHEYLKLLNPEGILSITRWVSLPPRDILKLFATATLAMEREGMQPSASLALVRGWKTITLLAKKGVFTPEQIEALRRFCAERSFDLEYYPGIRREEANRYNVLRRSDFFGAAQAILSDERWQFIERYKFDISPATDDRPYFFQSFKWRSLPELWAMREQGGLSLMEWGYPVLVVTLLQAVPISMLLIAAPLFASRKIRQAMRSPLAWRTAAYFAAIGFAFMFVEIAFIQKFRLFLTHPLYAVAVVLAAFLFFAGAGARLSESATGNVPRRLRGVVTVIAILALGYVFLLPSIFKPLMFLPDAAKIAIAVALIAPLAFAMGVPFPSGLVLTERRLPELIPWAWAVNGCASVSGAVLATVLAIHFGFTALIAGAVGLYFLAAMVLAGLARISHRGAG